jgi:hypothetical protein
VLHRRHLDVSQRALLADKLKPLFEAEARERMLAGRGPDPMANLPQGAARALAAQVAHVSPRSVDAATKVSQQGAPELLSAVESGKVSVSAAAALADLPRNEQIDAIFGGKKVAAAKAKEVRQKKKNARKGGPGKSKSKGAGKQRKANAGDVKPEAVAAPGAQAGVSITLPAKAGAVGRALAEALLKHWDRGQVISALNEALAFCNTETAA